MPRAYCSTIPSLSRQNRSVGELPPNDSASVTVGWRNGCTLIWMCRWVDWMGSRLKYSLPSQSGKNLPSGNLIWQWNTSHKSHVFPSYFTKCFHVVSTLPWSINTYQHHLLPQTSPTPSPQPGVSDPILHPLFSRDLVFDVSNGAFWLVVVSGFLSWAPLKWPSPMGERRTQLSDRQSHIFSFKLTITWDEYKIYNVNWGISVLG